MKNINIVKKILLVIFIFHITLSISINILSIENLKKKEGINFNIIGELYKKIKFSFILPKPVRQYAIYTGINNGFGFYSPNLPNSIKNVYFYADHVKLENITTTGESNVKFYTLMVNFTDNIKNEEVRKKIIQSLSKIYFNKYRTNKKLKVVLELKNIKSLNEYKETNIRYSLKNIEAYNIERNEKND